MEKKIVDWFQIESELTKAKSYPGFAFQVWCQINAEKIKKYLDVVKERSTPSNEYQVFARAAEDLKVKYAVKDEDGNPIIDSKPEGKQYRILDKDKESFESEIKPLMEANKELIESYGTQLNEYYKYIQEEMMDIDIKLLNGKNVPEKFFEDHPEQSLTFVEACSDLIKFE